MIRRKFYHYNLYRNDLKRVEGYFKSLGYKQSEEVRAGFPLCFRSTISCHHSYWISKSGKSIRFGINLKNSISISKDIEGKMREEGWLK